MNALRVHQSWSKLQSIIPDTDKHMNVLMTIDTIDDRTLALRWRYPLLCELSRNPETYSTVGL